MKYLSVRVRTSEDVKAAPLFDVPFGTDLDEVVRLIPRWGVYTSHGEFGAEGEFTGQFVVEDGEAFFEVIIELPERS